MSPTRRRFMAQTVGLGAAALAGDLFTTDWEMTARGSLIAGPPGGAEAAFSGLVARALCPEDGPAVEGMARALAAAMDDLIAGEYGRQASPMPPLDKWQHYFTGARVARSAALERFSTDLDLLGAAEVRAFLGDVRGGRIPRPALDLKSWFDEAVEPLVVRASFAAPVYNRFAGRVFSSVFG
jgi:hypothetical protein